MERVWWVDSVGRFRSTWRRSSRAPRARGIGERPSADGMTNRGRIMNRARSGGRREVAIAMALVLVAAVVARGEADRPPLRAGDGMVPFALPWDDASPG